MAESILAVVEKLTKMLVEEDRLLKGVKDKVETLMEQLTLMQAVVKDEDAKHCGNEAYNCWLSQIRDLGYQAVDVIETYSNDSESPGLLDFKFIRLHKVNGDIDKIQSRLKVLFEAKDGFSITPNTNPELDAANARRLRTWREPPAIMKEDDYIDLVEDTKVLIAQLSSMEPKLDPKGCPKLDVVSIVGMGGLGKTTLANKLYNHKKLQFECKVFISVSKEYRRKEILYRILDGVCAKTIDHLEKDEEKDVIIKLHSFLKEKRYLVVLDDLWEKEDWDSLKEAFPSGKGSKVMLTTRNREVAKHAGSLNPHEPRLLTDEESLELLRKKALPQCPHFPDELTKLGKEMVDKCGGLPLAVAVLGGLLSGKDPEQWENVYANSKWHIMNDVHEDRVSTILSLSYNYLPFHLKLCFQHLALFPEDFCIPKNELIRLWVAERFLPQQGKETEESIAASCIYELINRSMVLVATRTCRGRVKAIRIHDVLRDFSILKAKEGNFLEIYSGKGVGSTSSPKIKSRRLAIHGTYSNYAFLEPHTPHLRSLHFFTRTYDNLSFFYKHSKLLNVLELYGNESRTQDFCRLRKLSELRYLGFRGTTAMEMRNIVPAIESWTNLQTLDLRNCKTTLDRDIPDVLWKMKRLRHLLFNPSGPSSRDLRLDTLIHLQTLKGVSSGRWVKDDLIKLICMRRLGLLLLSIEEATLTLNSVTNLGHLQSLSLTIQPAFYGRVKPFPTLEQLQRCVKLQKLYLVGRIEKLRGAQEFPPNLVKLVLTKSHLQQDSIATLEKLPKLQTLVLGKESYESTQLVCSSEGFPRLEFLYLNTLRDLEEWTIKECAMMNLKHLSLENSELQHVPEGFKFLTTLEELHLSGSYFKSMFSELVDFTEKRSIKFVH